MFKSTLHIENVIFDGMQIVAIQIESSKPCQMLEIVFTDFFNLCEECGRQPTK